MKRDERSRSPVDSSYHERNARQRSSFGQSERRNRSFQEQNWQLELSDDENSNWAMYERERRNPRGPGGGPNATRYTADRGGLTLFNDPQAHSTGNRERFHGDRTLNDQLARPMNSQGDIAGPSRRIHETAQSGGNNSQIGLNKMFKVEPFPKGIKPTDQLQEWNYWLCNFEMAIEKAGIIGQRPKAIELSLHIGEEMRRIIIAKGMMPSERSVNLEFPFYDNVVEQMERHFRSLTDESVDVAAFNSLKQGERETALEFEFRLQQLAKRMNETNTAMIRTRYIEGLRDTELRNRAFVDGISLQETVKMATRKEAISAKVTEFLPWHRDERAAVTVAAVDRGDYGKRLDERDGYLNTQQGRNQGRKPERKAQDNGEKCNQCGVARHRFGKCPAVGKVCFDCNKIGHFRHMCPKKIRNVIVEGDRALDQVRNDF